MKRKGIQRILYFFRWQLLPVILALPAHSAFVFRGLGKTRSSATSRIKLARRSILIHLELECGHNPKEVLHIIEEIIELPSDLPGVIVECGAFFRRQHG